MKKRENKQSMRYMHAKSLYRSLKETGGHHEDKRYKLGSFMFTNF